MRGNLVKPPTDSAEEAGDEIGPERQLVGGKQGAGRDAEIGPARLAAEAWCAGRTPGVIADRATARRTDRLPVGFRPADLGDGSFHIGLGHGEDLGDGEGTGFGGQEEVLRHGI